MADDERAQLVRLEPPGAVIPQHASRVEIGDHRRRPRPLERRHAVGPVKAHQPGDAGMPRVLARCPKVRYQVPGHDTSMSAPQIKGADLFLALKAAVADDIDPVGQVEFMRPATGVFVHTSAQ